MNKELKELSEFVGEMERLGSQRRNGKTKSKRNISGHTSKRTERSRQAVGALYNSDYKVTLRAKSKFWC